MTTSAHPASTDTTPLDLLLGHARLPGAEQLLDPDRLSTLLGREVVLDRVRIKPGASVLVSYCTVAPGTAGGHRAEPAGGSTRGHDLGEIGWAQLVTSADKRRNLLRRAAHDGTELREHAEALTAVPRTGDGPFLLSGGLDSDSRLGGEIHRVLRRHRSGTAPRVLSFNPGRHAVLLLPGTGEVLRVAARPLDDLLQVTTHWRALGLPTVDQRRWRGRSTVLVGERWGQGDLAALASHPLSMPAAARLGGIIARLHAADVSEGALPAARIGDRVPETTDAVIDLLPLRAADIDRLAARVREALGTETPQVLIHGDLSPDQVLVSVDESEIPGEGRLPLRVVDLDRSGLGPAGADLGSWMASCLLAGVEEQATAFLEGYTRHLALPGAQELAAWTARALLAAALDPMRRHGEGWLPAVERRLALAEAVLDRPERLPLPATGHMLDGSAEGERSALVPARIEHHGRWLTVRRAWSDDGHGLPLELMDDAARSATATLRAARLEAATGQVTVLGAGSDPRLPGLARVLAENAGARVVSHRPGKRAVVRTCDDRGTVRFVKIVRPGRAERLREAMARAEDFTGPFRTAPVLAVDGDTVTFSELTGTLLHEGLPVADGTWRRAWRETLDAWSTAVDSSRRRAGAGDAPVHGPDAPVHGPRAEAEVLAVWLERAEAVDPLGAGARRRAVAAARRELARLGEVARPALIHRDLHDKQILWSPGVPPGLLDVDTATLGDPALDAANLRAHATWRALQGLWSEEQAAVVREEIDRAAERSGNEPETLAAYESATIARLACVYAFRPRWRSAARMLAASLAPTVATQRPTAVPVAGRTLNPPPAPAGDPTMGGTATPPRRSISR